MEEMVDIQTHTKAAFEPKKKNTTHHAAFR